MHREEIASARGKRDRRSVHRSLGLAVILFVLSTGLLYSLPPRASAYTPHPGISILGNGDFTAANGVTGGSGTPSDPYIIEGWDISYVDFINDPVWIEGTDAYFVIRDSYIHGGGYVALSGLAHARIENVTLADNLTLLVQYARDVALIA